MLAGGLRQADVADSKSLQPVLLALSQFRALPLLDKDVVASAWFLAKTPHIGCLSVVIVLIFHVTKRVEQNQQAGIHFFFFSYMSTFSRCLGDLLLMRTHTWS